MKAVLPNQPSAAQQRMIVNAFANYAGRAANVIISLMLIPVMIRHLGDAGYGIWVLFGSLLAFGSLFNFGLSNALTKFVSEYQAAGRIDDTRILIASGLSMYTALGTILAIACITASPLVPLWFEISEHQHATASAVFALAGISAGLSLPFSAATATLHGLHRFDLTSLLGSIRAVLFAAGTAAVLVTGAGLEAVAIVQLVSICLVQIPAVWLIYRLAPEYRFGVSKPTIHHTKTLLSFSWSLFVIDVGGLLQSRTDEIVIGTRLPVAIIAPYAVALKLSEIPQMIAEQFIALILPMASELAGQKNQAKLETLLVTSTRLTFGVFFSFGMLIAYFASRILELWIGPDYSVHATLVWVLVAALMFDTAQWPAALILQGVNRHRLLAASSLATGVANIALSLALIPYFGLLGVALGTLIPAALELLLIILPLVCRVIGTNVGKLVMQTLLPSALPMALPLSLLLWLDPAASALTPFEIIAFSTCFIGLYVALYLAYPTNLSERDLVRGLARDFYQRMRG